MQVERRELLLALEPLRAAYLGLFEQAIAEMKEGEGHFAIEVSLRVGDGKNPQGSRYNLPLRVDLLTDPKAPKPLCVSSEGALPLEPLSYLEASFFPFPWERCEITFEGACEPWAEPLGWFKRWFQAEAQGGKDDYAPVGVIHEMSEPEPQEGGASFWVDLGSAPPEALVDLVETLMGMDLKGVEVGRFEEETPGSAPEGLGA